MPKKSLAPLNGAANTQESEVAARVTRRHFTAAQKARILDEYEHASAIERAAICRRKHIYSSHLSNWRKQRASGGSLDAKRVVKLIHYRSRTPNCVREMLFWKSA